MKKLFLTALVASASLAAMADDYKYLTAAYNGVEQSFELATIRKIVFEESNVVITTTEGTVALPKDEMEKMFFSATPTAIDQLPLESRSLSIMNGVLRANGDGLLHVYSANGTLLHMAHVQGNTNISLSNLPQGVYIANLGDTTIKFVRK